MILPWWHRTGIDYSVGHFVCSCACSSSIPGSPSCCVTPPPIPHILSNHRSLSLSFSECHIIGIILSVAFSSRFSHTVILQRFFVVFFFFDLVLLCSSLAWPQTWNDSPASASCVLGFLCVCHHTQLVLHLSED